MQKFNKYAKKCVSVVVMLALVSCFFAVLCIPASAETSSWTTTELNDFFTYTYNRNGLSYYDVGLDGNMPEKNFLNEGYFQGIVTQGDFNYTLTCNIDNSFTFDPSKYYTLSFPLSFSTRLINIRDTLCSFSVVSRNNEVEAFKMVNAVWPDTISGNNNYWATMFFEGTFSGAFLVEMQSFKLTIRGWNYNSGSSSFYGGLLKNRYVTITETTKSEYDSIYGDPNTDYNKPSSEPQDDLHQIEQDLINQGALDNIGDFFSSEGNGGNSIVNVTNGLQAAGVLFSELFNNNGRRYTIFSMLINFSLTLGLVCLLINLAPKVFSGSSRSKDKGRKSNKGGKKG